MIVIPLSVLAIACASFGLANSVGLKFKPRFPAILSLGAGFIPALFLILVLTVEIHRLNETIARTLFYAPVILNLLAGACFLYRRPISRSTSTTLLFCVSGFLCSWIFGAILYFLIAMAHR
jgi:hypothetical protein